MTDNLSITSTDGRKAGTIFKGGILGDDDENWEVSGETKQASQVPIEVNQLQQNLNQFLVVVGDLFIKAEEELENNQDSSQTSKKSKIELDQIELSIGVNSEGKVSFWGLAEGKAGAMTQIKLTFKRKES